jgi:predicted alpha-1,6-mannanase (GH76 family)
MNTNKQTRQVIKLMISLMSASMLMQGTPAQAFWPSDADTSFNAFNNAFYVSNGGNAYYKLDTGSGTGPGWWTLAEEIEMAEDSYNRTLAVGTKNVVTALCNGFVAQYGTLWTANSFNDDITWAVIAFARAYQITGNTNFRDRAKANFDAMYSRAYDSNLGGGLWWTTGKTSKNACVNGPGSIASYLLYQIYGDSSYLTKAQNLYNWEKSTLFNAGTGQVYDNISSGGSVTTWVFSYNQGTFIGAANNLGQTGDATLAANCTKNTLCTGGILPDSGENGDGGGFNGIFLRWMAKFMKDRSLQSTYLPWLQLNANAAWNVRRTADNLSWCNWRNLTPTGTRYSFGCVNTPIALQVIPADGEGVMFCENANYEGVPSPLVGTGSFTLAQLQALGVGDNWASSLRVPPDWQVTMYQNDNFTGTSWTFTADTSYVGAAANDQMTSCKIQTTKVIFYKDAGYQGSRSQGLSKGNYTLAQLQASGIGNDWASSLRVPPGWTVIVYQNDNFTGTSWTFTADTSYVGSAANDQMTSCKIQ